MARIGHGLGLAVVLGHEPFDDDVDVIVATLQKILGASLQVPADHLNDC